MRQGCPHVPSQYAAPPIEPFKNGRARFSDSSNRCGRMLRHLDYGLYSDKWRHSKFPAKETDRSEQFTMHYRRRSTPSEHPNSSTSWRKDE